jgi:hypothetical protein
LVIFCSFDQFGSCYIEEHIATATSEEKAIYGAEIIPYVFFMKQEGLPPTELLLINLNVKVQELSMKLMKQRK